MVSAKLPDYWLFWVLLFVALFFFFAHTLRRWLDTHIRRVVAGMLREFRDFERLAQDARTLRIIQKFNRADDETTESEDDANA
jgi:type II secretory pathway component PulF